MHGKDERFLSPFAVNAASHGLSFSGGKLDDVTVVVSRVCDISPPSPTASAPAQSSKQAAHSKSPELSVGWRTAARAGSQGDLSEPAYMSSPVSSAESSNE